MIRKSIRASVLALALLLSMAAAPVTVRSQDDGVKPTAGDEKNIQDQGKIDKVPEWSIKPELEGVGESMKKFNTLIGSLNRANKDLSDEFQK